MANSKDKKEKIIKNRLDLSDLNINHDLLNPYIHFIIKSSDVHPTNIAIVAVAAVAAMLIATSAISVEDAFAGGKKKKEYNQATSQTNACGNDLMPLNVGCQNTGSQVQGDENGVALVGQQTFEEAEIEEEPLE